MEPEGFFKVHKLENFQFRKALRKMENAVKRAVKNWRPMIVYLFIFLLYYFLLLFSYSKALWPAEDHLLRDLLDMAKWKVSREDLNAILPRLLEELATLFLWSFGLLLPTFLFTSFHRAMGITIQAMVAEEEDLEFMGLLFRVLKKWNHTIVTSLHEELFTSSSNYHWVGISLASIFIRKFSIRGLISGEFILVFGLILTLYLEIMIDLGNQRRKGMIILIGCLRYYANYYTIIGLGVQPGAKYTFLDKAGKGLSRGLLLFYSTVVDMELYKECRLLKPVC